MLKLIKYIRLIGLLLMPLVIQGQIKVSGQDIYIKFDSLSGYLEVHQKTQIVNLYNQAVDSIVWLNWANAYNNKQTDLAKSFIENYDLNFHFTRKKNRGYVRLENLLLINDTTLKPNFYALKDDVFVMKLPEHLQPNDSIKIVFKYLIKLPEAKFTGYGIDKQGNMLLKNFFYHPAPDFQAYSDRHIDNYPSSQAYYKIKLDGFDSRKKFFSNLNNKNDILTGTVKHPVISITSEPYQILKFNKLKFIIYNNDNKLIIEKKKQIIDKILNYLREKLGDYPEYQILITKTDFKNRKVYGFDLLPKFLNPYDRNLLWELSVLHQLSFKYLNKLQTDRRKNAWIIDGLAAFIEYEYLRKYHPDLKLLGKATDYKLIKFYYASQVKMTEKYPWLYLYMARMNKDQALMTSLDSLTNFNRVVSMPFKAALGFKMLQKQVGDSLFNQKLKQNYQSFVRQNMPATDSLLINLAHTKTTWAYDFVHTRKKYDYKLKSLKIKNDTLIVKIKNKKQTLLPLSLYAVKDDSVTLIKHIPAFKKDTIIKLSNYQNTDFIGFNYFNDYPELQIKNNFKRPGFHLFEKPLQIRPYQDFDNPLKSQIFINPFFEYNYYDGIILGAQIFNQSVLHNHFNYVLTPSYATKNKTLTGSLSFSNTHFFDSFNPFSIKYGFGFSYYHYNHDLVYRKYNPYVELKYRSPNLRQRKGQILKLQYMNINKDPVAMTQNETEKYGVLALKYAKFDVNVIKDFFITSELQLAQRFGKTAFMARYRFLTDKNRQWDFRLYAGKFLYNRTVTDYFSFALDRPTDYLFQYNYYGRSETSGIFHQQFIWAEGGFKTFFTNQYANDFIISNNLNIGIWKWFNLYGDWAWLKNKAEPVKFYYDSGVRINLVQDYFEIFFPVYSKLGWEINQPDYLSRVRMVFTMDINGLFKMFSRGWY